MPQIKKLQLSDYIRSIAATPAKGNPPPQKKADFFTKLYKTLQNPSTELMGNNIQSKGKVSKKTTR
ncbi:hypothetical protein B9T07_07365 [Limnospira fusiformis CCALA 023]